MSTITREFSKEQLIAAACSRIDFAKQMLRGNPLPLAKRKWEIELSLSEVALASLEAEPVAWRHFQETPTDGGYWILNDYKTNCSGVEPLYTAPAAPASVPDELSREEYKRRFMEQEGFDDTYRGGWNACRATMLQGAENARSPTTMQTAPALDYSPKIAESPAGINQGKSEPVTTAYKLRDAVETIRSSGIAIDADKIFAERDALNAPDCWCRTCRPITHTDMRFVVCPDCGNKRCPHANDHRNACTGSNEPGQEGSAYPAAPQQEMK